MQVYIRIFVLILLIPMMLSTQLVPDYLSLKETRTESALSDNSCEYDSYELKKQDLSFPSEKTIYSSHSFQKLDGVYQEGKHPQLSEEPATPPPKA